MNHESYTHPSTVELYCSLHANSTMCGVAIELKLNGLLKYSSEVVLYFTWIKPMEAFSIADTYLNVVSCHLPIKSFLKQSCKRTHKKSVILNV